MENKVAFTPEEVIQIIQWYSFGIILLYAFLIIFAVYKWFAAEKRFEYRLIGLGAALVAPIIGSIILIILSSQRKKLNLANE